MDGQTDGQQKNNMPPIFLCRSIKKSLPRYLTLTLTDDLDPKEKVLPQGMHNYVNYQSSITYIHAICPRLSGTVPEFATLSWRPGNYEIVPEI